MAKKSRATFHKREKERARQQKQQDKAQRRLDAKARRGAGLLDGPDEEAAIIGMSPEPYAVLVQGDDAPPTN